MRRDAQVRDLRERHDRRQPIGHENIGSGFGEFHDQSLLGYWPDFTSPVNASTTRGLSSR